MSDSEQENADEALEECSSCGESMLTVYIEDGRCRQCQE
jgi:hypothetical protein